MLRILHWEKTTDQTHVVNKIINLTNTIMF